MGGGWKVERYSDGEKKAEGQITYSLRTGPWTFYLPDGRVDYQGFFIKGRKDGSWVYYDYQRRQQKIVTYKLDRPLKRAEKPFSKKFSVMNQSEAVSTLIGHWLFLAGVRDFSGSDYFTPL
ncbi:hypothetical protein WDW86_10275 [Bdellovibrionota bacterium FG-2]